MPGADPDTARPLPDRRRAGSPNLVQAREFAAAFLAGIERPDLARLVCSGEGDDFPEVIVAARLLGQQAVRLDRQEQALRTYADADFWDDEMPGGSLVCHDKGEIARNVLAGRPPFHHRD